jgi:hypothetical protein
MPARFLKVIACEIAFREICHVAARSLNLVDLEFLTQGLHDTPCAGCGEIQRRIDAVPAGRYDAILIGYGLCGNILTGLKARHTPLVFPRAHDCITFFLGSKERYQQISEARVGAYFYTSGWLECLRRRGEKGAPANAAFLPTRAGVGGDTGAAYEVWVQKFGEERARYLVEMMDEWTQHYTHGVLIDFAFTKPLQLDEQVKQICAKRGWQFEQVRGDLGLLQRWVDGQWDAKDFLVVQPSEKVAPSYDEEIIEAEPLASNAGLDVLTDNK